MPVKLQIAHAADVPDLLSLRAAVNQHLTSKYGKGFWSGGLTEKGVLFAMRISTVYVARRRNQLIATFTLSTRKPWAIDKTYFSPSSRPLYLTTMAVHPSKQGQGIGTLCLKEAQRIAKKWPADAIRLDAGTPTQTQASFTESVAFEKSAGHPIEMHR